jgi:hypothetical protein
MGMPTYLRIGRFVRGVGMWVSGICVYTYAGCIRWSILRLLNDVVSTTDVGCGAEIIMMLSRQDLGRRCHCQFLHTVFSFSSKYCCWLIVFKHAASQYWGPPVCLSIVIVTMPCLVYSSRLHVHCYCDNALLGVLFTFACTLYKFPLIVLSYCIVHSHELRFRKLS